MGYQVTSILSDSMASYDHSRITALCLTRVLPRDRSFKLARAGIGPRVYGLPRHDLDAMAHSIGYGESLPRSCRDRRDTAPIVTYLISRPYLPRPIKLDISASIKSLLCHRDKRADNSRAYLNPYPIIIARRYRSGILPCRIPAIYTERVRSRESSEKIRGRSFFRFNNGVERLRSRAKADRQTELSRRSDKQSAVLKINLYTR